MENALYITVREYAHLVRAPSGSAGFVNPSLALQALIRCAYPRNVIQGIAVCADAAASADSGPNAKTQITTTVATAVAKST